MKEKIVDVVVEKTGIERSKAEQAVDTVLDYVKENPGQLKELVGIEPAGPALRERVAPVAEKGKEAFGEARERVAPMAEKGKEALGEAREKLAPRAAAAGEKLGDVGEKVGGRLRGLFKRDGHKEVDKESVPEAASTSSTSTD